METQKYTININLYRKFTLTKMKTSNLLVSVVLLFINEQYRKKQIKGKIKTKQKKEIKINQEKGITHSRPLPFHFERSINKSRDQ